MKQFLKSKPSLEKFTIIFSFLLNLSVGQNLLKYVTNNFFLCLHFEQVTLLSPSKISSQVNDSKQYANLTESLLWGTGNESSRNGSKVTEHVRNR